MFSLTVRDTIMIAHSLAGAVFGPAQRMHGATFVVEATLWRHDLDGDGIVADIGLATTVLAGVLEPLKYRNLDELPQFAGVNTTTEFLCRHVFDGYAARVRAGALGGDTATALHRLRIRLRETPDAWADYDGALYDGARGEDAPG